MAPNGGESVLETGYEQFTSKMCLKLGPRRFGNGPPYRFREADGDSDALLQTVRTPELWAKSCRTGPAKTVPAETWKTIEQWLPICVPLSGLPAGPSSIDLVRQDRDSR
jgi:hypothetical protein